MTGAVKRNARGREVAYDRIGVGYAKHLRADPRIVEPIARALSAPPPATIADIGAGTGNYSRALADLGYSVDAVEPSGIMRGQAVPHVQVPRGSGFSITSRCFGKEPHRSSLP